MRGENEIDLICLHHNFSPMELGSTEPESARTVGR